MICTKNCSFRQLLINKCIQIIVEHYSKSQITNSYNYYITIFDKFSMFVQVQNNIVFRNNDYRNNVLFTRM